MIAAWVSIAIIAYATLTDVQFVYGLYYKVSPFLMRPTMRRYAHVEHVVAFAVFGALFSFAYPKRLLVVCAVVLGSAISLEYLQTLTPDRHGTAVDAFEKMLGGAGGILAAHLLLYFFSKKYHSNPR